MLVGFYSSLLVRTSLLCCVCLFAGIQKLYLRMSQKRGELSFFPKLMLLWLVRLQSQVYCAKYFEVVDLLHFVTSRKGRRFHCNDNARFLSKNMLCVATFLILEQGRFLHSSLTLASMPLCVCCVGIRTEEQKEERRKEAIHELVTFFPGKLSVAIVSL